MCKLVEEQRSPGIFCRNYFLTWKWHYCEQKIQRKNSNLWVKWSCDIRIRFITTFRILSHSFFPKTCSSRPFSLSRWESEKKERKWANVMLHSLRTEWYSINCMLCFSPQTICPNKKKNIYNILINLLLVRRTKEIADGKQRDFLFILQRLLETDQC